MGAVILELDANSRTDLGKGASRRLRKQQDLVPAILYGGKQSAVPISLFHNKIIQALDNEAFYSSILTIKLDGKEQKVVLKDLHRHPYKKQILHADFLRVSGTDIITMKVPLHFLNADNCPGVKAGGIINHSSIDLEIKCKAKDLPKFIEIDLSTVGLDQAIHLSEITLPNGVEIVALGHGEGHDSAIVNVHSPRGNTVEEGTTDTNAAAVPSVADEKKAAKEAQKKQTKK